MFPLISAAVAASLMNLPILSGSLRPSFTARLNEGRAAAVQVRVVVSPVGVPIHCSSSFVNGPPSNVVAFCSMLQTSTRFSAAHDPKGQPAYGVVYLWAHWQHGRWAGSRVPSWNPPDLAITTNRLPKGLIEGVLLQFVLQTDKFGKVAHCIGPPRLTQQVLDLLCRTAGAQSKTPATDERGQPVPSVQEFIMRVTSQPFLDDVVKRIRSL